MNEVHDWQPFTDNPRFARCTRCQTTRCEDRQTPGLYWYRIPGVNCGPAYRFHGISTEPPCDAVTPVATGTERS